MLGIGDSCSVEIVESMYSVIQDLIALHSECVVLWEIIENNNVELPLLDICFCMEYVDLKSFRPYDCIAPFSDVSNFNFYESVETYYQNCGYCKFYFKL